MGDLFRRLDGCFQAVFPDLSDEEIRQATPDAVAAWDSMATVTLLAVVNEEFNTELDLDRMEDLLSYSKLAEWLAGNGKEAE